MRIIKSSSLSDGYCTAPTHFLGISREISPSAIVVMSIFNPKFSVSKVISSIIPPRIKYSTSKLPTVPASTSKILFVNSSSGRESVKCSSFVAV